MSTEIRPAKAVAHESARDLWAAEEWRYRARTLHWRKGDPNVVLAVWPAEPIPDRYADQMQAIVSRCLRGSVEQCCPDGFGGTVMAAFPSKAYCEQCIRDIWFTTPGMEFCDRCRTLTSNLRVVFALASPYVIEAWLCHGCSR